MGAVFSRANQDIMLRFLISRPIGVLMTTVALLVISVVFVRNIPVALLPDIPIPRLSVQISAPDLDARTLETTVVRSIRNQLMQVNDLKDLTSRTRNGSAVINIELNFGTDTDLASIELNEKMDQIMHQLPKELERPRVIKTNISDIPVFYLDLFVKDTALITEIAFAAFVKKTIRKRLEQIPEIAFVDMHGLAQPEVVVIPRADILASLDIEESLLSKAIVDANIRLGNIILKDGAYQYNVELASKLVDIDDIRKIFINISGQVYQLRDLAEVVYTQKLRRGAFIYDDNGGVSLAVRRKSNANNFKLRSAINVLMADLETQHPEIAFHLSNDQSEILEVSIANLRTSLYYGLGFAALVMFLFFRDWRMPVLIIITIPIGLLLTLFGFYLLNISINIISLAGLILGVGLMIDNAIIIIENIKQKNSQLDLRDAAAAGANEVVRPLISSALTTSSVFLPLILLSGLAGVLFYDQALSIALALTSSILVSYFFLPVLSTILLGASRKEKFTTRRDFHARFIIWFVTHRAVLIPVFLLLGCLLFWPYSKVEKRAFPELTRVDYSIKIDWNEQLALEESSNRYFIVREAIGPWIDKSTAYIGELQYFLVEDPQHINESEIIVQLKGATLIGEVEEQLRSLFKNDFPLSNYSIQPLANVFDQVFSQESHEVYAHIQSTEGLNIPSYEEVKPIYTTLRTKYGEVFTPSMDKYIGLKIDRDNLLRYNIDYSALVSKLKFLFRNNEVTQLRGGDEFVPVQITNAMEVSDVYAVLDKAQIRNVDGVLLPINSFIGVGLYEDYKSVTSIRSGECLTIPFRKYSSGLLTDVRNVIRKYKKYTVQFTGSYFEQEQLRQEMLLVGGVVFLLLFLILAAQFESLIQPLIVALTLPVGILGALLALYFLGESINIIAIIGIIIMSGIDVNDAILKIDMINRNVSVGMPIDKAIVEGSERRIRPILMTSITTILAMMPILFSEGLGAELQRPLAVAVIGGLIFGTFASIVMVPMLYRFIYVMKVNKSRDIIV